MIIFLFGNDTYRSTQKLNQIKQKYISSSGEINLTFIEDNFDLEKIKAKIMALPFLSEKRLIIFKNFIKNAKKEVADGLSEVLTQIPQSTAIIFWEEGEPDKRLKITKRLLKEKFQQSDLLSGVGLSQWIKKEVSDLGGTIENEAINLLCAFVGNNLWQLHNEIQKLISFDEKITAANVKLLVKNKISANIFEFADAIGNRNVKLAINLLHALIDSGEPEIYILTMITRQIRNIILIKDSINSGLGQSEIAQKLGLHPYVVSKTIPQTRNFQLKDLKNIYQALLDCDIAIKTGQKDSILCLDLLVQKLCCI